MGPAHRSRYGQRTRRWAVALKLLKLRVDIFSIRECGQFSGPLRVVRKPERASFGDRGLYWVSGSYRR